MDGTTTRLHRRLIKFVGWIQPEPATVDSTRIHMEGVLDRIEAELKRTNRPIAYRIQSGSFAKHTGLRRHLPGGSNVEGFDVDAPFVFQRGPGNSNQQALFAALEAAAAAVYPSTERVSTKSSTKLIFSGQKLSYDLVPMLATNDRQRQILIRSNGEQLETSVQGHVEFVRGRTAASKDTPGRVKFNECVRLVKWWRHFREDTSTLRVPTIVLELLCSYAFDSQGVRATYHDTLADWFGFLAHTVQRRTRVAFPAPGVALRPPTYQWEVIDPYAPQNIITASWAAWQVDELAQWFATGRDLWNRAISADQRGDHAASMTHLVSLFGTPFKHHGEV